MAKAGNKLMKIRSALKKMNSFGNKQQQQRPDNAPNNSIPEPSSGHCDVDHTSGSVTVYVGKSLRPYQVSDQVLVHPVIQELVVKSDGSDCSIIIGCEVVLFEHLLWMLQNNVSTDDHFDDLVGFYAY